jgi:hypothetical protein
LSREITPSRFPLKWLGAFVRTARFSAPVIRPRGLPLQWQASSEGNFRTVVDAASPRDHATMAFTPVNELERLLIAAATDAAARPNFYRALLDHELLVITEGQKSAAPGVRTLGEGESIRIRLLEIQGKLHAPVFSSSERIAAVVSEEVGFLAMKGSAVLQMLRGKDVILNPGSDYGKLFPPQEIEAMLDGSIFGSKKLDVGGQKILLGQPKEYPHRLVDSLSRFLESSAMSRRPTSRTH